MKRRLLEPNFLNGKIDLKGGLHAAMQFVFKVVMLVDEKESNFEPGEMCSMRAAVNQNLSAIL